MPKLKKEKKTNKPECLYYYLIFAMVCILSIKLTINYLIKCRTRSHITASWKVAQVPAPSK